VLSGCGGSASLLPGAHSQGAVIPRSTRELTDVEKISLAKSLPANFNDPDSANFRWLPVIYQAGEQQAEYCGLVNAKNSVGGHSGYKVFHAVLQLDPRGQFTNGLIDHPKSGADLGAKANGDVTDGVTDDLCRRAGYVDFSQAK
jgi:hypothetical protein